MKNLSKSKDIILKANGLSLVFECQEPSESGSAAGRLESYKDFMDKR